ncbi:hypothetical protein [Streptomyces sp. NPDC096311]|uniref:hypothetical protein n=1 Tax=Streptomyces sp. NPDC096311 TaxID=3366083 RepID=UPI00381B7F67
MTASADSGLTLDGVLDLSTALGSRRCEELEYPQDYAPDDIRSMNNEVEQLHQLRTRLMVLQVRWEAESSA